MREARPKNIRSLLLTVLIFISLAFQVQAYYHPDAGRWISRDPIEEDGGANLNAFARNNGVCFVDMQGTSLWDDALNSRAADWLVCMGECIEANDPMTLLADKWLLSVSGGKLPKTFVAKLCTWAGDSELAGKILATMKWPGASKMTSVPGSVAMALRSPGKLSQVLHGVGAGMGAFWQTYGLYMASAEAACVGHCCASRDYNEGTGIEVPIDLNHLIEEGTSLLNVLIDNWKE